MHRLRGGAIGKPIERLRPAGSVHGEEVQLLVVLELGDLIALLVNREGERVAVGHLVQEGCYLKEFPFGDRG